MIPEGWSQEQLRDVIDGSIKNGYSPLPADKITGLWVLGLGALQDGSLNEKEIKPAPDNEKVRGCLLENGDFLISRSNTPEKVGRVAVFRDEIKNCSYPDLMMRLKIDDEKASPGYMEHVLKSYAVRSYFRRSAAGSSGSMIKINKSIVEKTSFLLPPKSEQKRIACILSTWDEAITTTERLLEASQRQKLALMQQLLIGKRRLPGFVGAWKKIKLGEVIKEEKKRNRDGAIERVLSVTNHSGFVLPEESFSKRVASDNVSNYRVVKRGQFGYNPSRINVGSFARLEKYEIGVLSPMYVVFSVDEKSLDGKYFEEWMSSDEARQRINSSTQGSVRDSVGFDALCAFPFKLPPLPEQRAIVSILVTAGNEIEALQEKIKCLSQEKKALMQQLLTGKRRVKVEAEAEATI
ncbi:type I restriction enzyme S subunit [Modicisalibacter xianhensis]|uniref:Type I restriction enzyme S subunit n=1 Tax=Modicisalibacter xianhensis TaxID=442341 RepID=A0A4R8FL93_9GAMM|nr:restriction endonuclease subunit S [Halomonas xianhensis]TDX22941.1 type I restriction enzyme S subunit [Halomonas xianhensis]